MCKPVRLMLLGDVMMGRGVDQILPHPGDPTLYEDSMDGALGYVELAERAGARISRPVPFDYVWGDAFEGIGGHESFRGDLGLVYLADLDPSSGALRELRMVPTRVRGLRANRASEEEAERLERTLNREGAAFGTRVRRTAGNLLRLEAGAGLPLSSAEAPPSAPGPASGRAGRRKRGPP